MMTVQRKPNPSRRRYRKSFGKPGGSTVALIEFAKTMDRIERGVTDQELADAAAHLKKKPAARQTDLNFRGLHD